MLPCKYRIGAPINALALKHEGRPASRRYHMQLPLVTPQRAGTNARWQCCALEYVPSPMDPATQASQIGVVLLIAAALPTSWWLLVVPTARQKLAIDKRRGPLREFLEKVDLEGNVWSRWFFTKWLNQMPAREKALQRNLSTKVADSDVEGKELADQSTVAERSTKKRTSSVENFISGDNPIIVVMSILGIFVAVQVALHPR